MHISSSSRTRHSHMHTRTHTHLQSARPVPTRTDGTAAAAAGNLDYQQHEAVVLVLRQGVALQPHLHQGCVCVCKHVGLHACVTLNPKP